MRLFVASTLLFTLTSWLCGFATSLEMLVASRVMQGRVAGPMMPLSQTPPMSSYPRERVGTALALWGMTTLVAPVVGRLAAAAGLSSFVRITAGAMGRSIASTVWEDRAALYRTHLTEHLGETPGLYAQALDTLVQAGLTPEQAVAQIGRIVDQQAFTRSVDDILAFSAMAFLALVGFVWLTRRVPRLR